MANEQLAQLAALLGGGNQRFYAAGDTAAATPIVSPQQSAGVSDEFLARALGGRAPRSVGQGIFSAAQSISNAMQANRKDEKAKADQATQVKAAQDMLAQLTTGQPGALNAGEMPMVPDANAPMDQQAQAMGLDRPAGPMTTGGSPPTVDPNSPMAALTQAMIGSGQVMPALNFMGQHITAQDAAKTKAASDAAAFRRDLAKTDYKAGLDEKAAEKAFDRELDKIGLTSKLKGAEKTAIMKNLEASGLQPGTPEYADAMIKAVTKPQVSIGGSLSPGQKKSDQEAAGTYNAFVTEGGFADARKGIAQLRGVREKLKTSDSLTGAFVGNIPRSVRTVVAPESVTVQDQVEEVVQRNLRLILGAQFTAAEGERLIQRAYNPALSEAENGKRIDRLLKAMEDAYTAKTQAMQYFEQNGTMTGYKGAAEFTMADIERAAGLGDEKEGIKAPSDMSDDELRKELGL
ncbi:MAG: hypothetical protein GEU92_19025 [Alphaproteobacteria bacterium]|nr:hypothetical protein [Alphaproteobacteria bacterium]